METLAGWLETARPFLPLLLTLAVVLAGLFATRFLLERQAQRSHRGQFRSQLVMLALTFVGLLAVIVALPVSEAIRGQILSLIGIVLSAAIAISSTTFLGNAMAGILLRALRNFRMGDFVAVGDHFGRVSERGLFHTEIQTEDRDLTTLPNLYLVTHPVKVVRASGTIVSASVSLGYDLSHRRVEGLLLEAAAEAGLEEPFVHIVELGDSSVTYRVAGLLTEVKQLLSSRSRLRAAILTELHGAEIEIVSPNFMNTRALAEGVRFIAQESGLPAPGDDRSAAEALVFDKADEAESRELLSEQSELLGEWAEELERRVERAEPGEERARLEQQLARTRALRERWPRPPETGEPPAAD